MTARPIDLVIFDCDGVLVDSERLAVAVDRRALAKLGWVMTEAEVIDRFVGRSDDAMIADIEAHLSQRLPDGWMDQLQELYRDAFEKELVPVRGILEALDEIKTLTCVASSGSFEKVQYTLELTGLYDRFEARIFSATEVSRGKPSPDLFLYAAKCMEVDPACCCVVEDSRHGVEAGRAAGMRVFGFAGGMTRADRLCGEDTVTFEDMRDLPRLLREAECSA